jgi:hypothetical protein
MAANGWLSAHEAAERLGCRIRSVQAVAQAHNIECWLSRGERFYNAADIELVERGVDPLEYRRAHNVELGLAPNEDMPPWAAEATLRSYEEDSGREFLSRWGR